MAKRKKSKKHPKSETAAQAPALDANENVVPSETAADALTADPTISEASASAVAEEIPPQAEAFDPAHQAVAEETNPDETSSEYGAVWSSDAPVADAGPADAVPLQTAPAETATEVTTPAVPEATAIEEVWAADTATGAETLAATSDSETSEAAPTEAGEVEEVLASSRLESILESLLFASDKPLGMAELKRLLGERDGKKVTAAVEALTERRKGAGIEVAALSSGWHLRTNPENAAWVSKLLVGRPVRLSRAMLETLAIVAYRQPVTRPEVDDIRGVDCGPVLKTLLDRGLVRIIGKKEEVGRPMLYGTTPEFLRIFNLRDLSELPTLREFYDLSTEDQSRVEAEHGPPAEPPSATSPKPDVALNSVMRGALQPEPDDTDPLLDELDEASQLAKQALGELEPKTTEDAEAAEATQEATADEGEGPDPEAPAGRGKTGEEPPASPPAAGE
ncbi:MAG TPA: SMC-Scp complex subunit ScpB [Polyangia bacterium]